MIGREDMRNVRLITYLLIAILVFSLSPAQTLADDTDTYLSEEIQEACIKYGEEYSICPELLMAMVEAESSGRSNVSNGNCVGLMQINEKIHEERIESLGVDDIRSVDGNIHVGADLVSELFEKYGDIYAVLMAYNEGEYGGAVERAYEGEWSRYAKNIVARSEQLERLHDK